MATRRPLVNVSGVIKELATADKLTAGVDFTPAGNLAATNVQAAIEELDSEKYAATDGLDVEACALYSF